MTTAVTPGVPLNGLPFTRSGQGKQFGWRDYHEEAAASSRHLPGRSSEARQPRPAVGVQWPVGQRLLLRRALTEFDFRRFWAQFEIVVGNTRSGPAVYRPIIE